MILYLTAGLFGGYNETIKFEELGISTHSLTRRLTKFVLFVCVRGGHFNSQPHKEADRSRSYHSNIGLYFNSQPHKEADDDCTITDCYESISTHSLTRRLTFQESGKENITDISTHSLTRRLTTSPEIDDVKVPFQLTASQGG